MNDRTPMSVHLVLKPERPSRPEFDDLVHPDPESKPGQLTADRAKECVERTGLSVRRVGEWDLFVVGTVGEFERLFRSRVVTVDGDLLFSPTPTIPVEWRDVISDVVLPPPVKLAL